MKLREGVTWVSVRHPTNRWRELICVLIGHEWDKYENEMNDDGDIQAEANQCSRCKLAKRMILIRESPTMQRWVAY